MKRSQKRQKIISRLKEYRREQALKAIRRDNGYCQICKVRRANDVHHVFGRGRDADSWRERYTALMCVCRECHPSPLYLHDWDSDHEIVKIAREINGITGD